MSDTDLLLTGSSTHVIGLAFLANAALLSRPRRAIEDLFGARPESLAGCLDTELRKTQSLFGFGFLFLGFALNFAGLLVGGGPERGGPTALFGVLAGLVLLLTAAGAVGATRMSRRSFKRHLREFFRRNTEFPFERHMDLTKELGEVFEIPRSESDSVEDYVLKVRRFLGVLGEPARGVRGVRPVRTPIRPTAVGF